MERFAAIADVSVDALVDVARYAVVELAPRGGVVFRRGDAADGMYLVLDGQVVLEIDGAAVGRCGPSQWFGEIGLFTGGSRTADARVAVDAVLIRLDAAGWAALAARSPRLLASLCERLARQLRAAAERARPSRTVIACAEPAALIASLRRQCPDRPLEQIDAGGAALEHALAALTAPDVLVVATAPSAPALADRVVAQVAATTWSITPGYGRRPVDVVRAATAEIAIDRVARRLAGVTVGLALGAGGAYGLAHIGLVLALDAAGIPVDYVAGTSIGAIVGAAVAAGVGGARMQAFAHGVARRYRGLVIRDLDLRGRSWLRGRAVMDVLGELDGLRDARFETLDVPFVAVAMDVDTGAEVVIDTGPVLDGIRPSFAMPDIFPACERDGRRLVDGAMMNPVPVDRVRALGADVVVALQPIPPLAPVPPDPVGHMLGRARRLARFLPGRAVQGVVDRLEVSVRSFQAMWRQLGIQSAAHADVLVTPDLERFFFLQFGAASEIIEAGRVAAEEALARDASAGAARLLPRATTAHAAGITTASEAP